MADKTKKPDAVYNNAPLERAMRDLADLPPILRDRNEKGQWVIRYYFSGENEAIPPHQDVARTDSFADAQRETARHIFGVIEEEANIKFIEVKSAAKADIRLTGANFLDYTGGILLEPKPENPRDVLVANAIWAKDPDMNGKFTDNDFAVGKRLYGTLMHEICHALGMGHPDKRLFGGGEFLYSKNKDGSIMSRHC
jgi:hypothetical protein